MLALNSFANHAQAAAAYTWVKTTKSAAQLLEGPDMCAGIKLNPATWAGYTSVAVGPCTSKTTGPPVYIEQDLVDLIFVNGADAYLADEANKLEKIDPTAGSSNGYRDFTAEKEVGTGNKYAYMQTGGFYGVDPASSGGYVGTANYIVTDGTITTATNDFYLAQTVGDARVTRDQSTDGAPNGPWAVCISPVTSGGACGAARSFKEGTYKFSVYGYTSGTSYALPTFGSTTATEFGVRMKLKLVGATGAIDLHFNNDPALTLAKLGSTSVTSFSVTSGEGTIEFAFQSDYNIGDVPTSGTSGNVPTPTATKKVKIRASAVPSDKTSVYVDFLFIASDFAAAGKYFIYDPTLTTKILGVTSAATKPAITAVATALVGAAAVATMF